MLDALAPWLAVAVGASLAREASRDAHARAAKAARERVRAASRLREVLGRHPRPAFEVSLEGLVDPLNDTATRALTQKGEALARALAQATLSEHPRWRSVAAETGEGASFLVLEREAAADAREASARFARALALTPRQAEVLERLVLGASNREIARGMGCADVTVEKHVATLFARSGAPDRARLAIAVLTGEAPSAPRAPAVERSAPPAWQPALEPEPVASAALRLPEDTAAEPPTLIGLLVGRTEVPFASRRRDLASMLAEPRRGSARERVREEVYGRVARAVSHHAALHALVEALARSLRAQLDAEGVQIAVGSPSRLELLLEAPEGVRLRRVLSRGGEDVGALEVFVRAELIERATLTMDLLAPFVAARVGASLDRAAAEEALAAAMGDETTAALLVGATAEARRAARRPAQTVAARASAFAARLRVGARDREVLQLLAQGRSNKEIATSLGVAEVTIEARLTALYRRARVRGRQGLLLAMLTP
jgi:DNA-binding NarL/FixJ family response regulator